jgi:hypothetical protein
LVNAAVDLGDIFLASPDIDEFELNPVIVNPQGKGLRVVDALIVASAEGAKDKVPVGGSSDPSGLK